MNGANDFVWGIFYVCIILVLCKLCFFFYQSMSVFFFLFYNFHLLSKGIFKLFRIPLAKHQPWTYQQPLTQWTVWYFHVRQSSLLVWFPSHWAFLQCVVAGHTFLFNPLPKRLSYGLVLGPLLFAIYTMSLCPVLVHVASHITAMQMTPNCTCHSKDLAQLSACLSHLSKWMKDFNLNYTSLRLNSPLESAENYHPNINTTTSLQ